MTDKGRIDDGFVLIKKDKIEKVGTMDLCPKFNEEDVIDAKSMSLFPGFIDAYTSVGVSSNTCFCQNKNIESNIDISKLVAPEIRTLDSVNLEDNSFKEALFSGVTSVVVSPFLNTEIICGQNSVIKTYGKKIEDMTLNPLSAINFSLNNLHISTMSVFSIIRKELSNTQKYMEDKDFAISDFDNCETPKYNAKHEVLNKLLKKDIPLYIDALTKSEIFTAIRAAKELSIKLTLINPFGIYSEEKELLNENISIIFSPFFVGKNRQNHNEIAKMPGIFAKLNVPIAITTGFPNIPISCLTFAAALALKHGMDWLEAIKSITIYPAKICGIQNKVGTIEESKTADLVLFEKDPLNILEKPKLIICSGKKIL
ncbi:MAG: amidohydrolase family protein [Oscillospiraceae bacterium]|nr:amidohydrolase family protein [Oscillospiraceae bacterium]